MSERPKSLEELAVSNAREVLRDHGSRWSDAEKAKLPDSVQRVYPDKVWAIGAQHFGWTVPDHEECDRLRKAVLEVLCPEPEDHKRE